MSFAQAKLKALLKGRSGPFIEAVIYGLCAGLAVVVFEESINLMYHHVLAPMAQWSTGAFLLGSLLLIVGTSLVAGFLLSIYAPEAAGSGIPQLKVAFWKDFGYVPFRVVWVKLIAGVLSVGGGCSLGREGPSVQLAGALASNVAGWMGTAKNGRRRALAAGAAAGLAAAFNTPISAVAFVLEEVLGDLNSPLLGSVVVASVLGAFTVHTFLGSHPAFSLPMVEGATWRGMLLVPVVSLAAGFLGVWFQRLTLGLRVQCRVNRVIARVPEWLRPAVGALLTWMIAVSVFLTCGRLGIFGLGYDDLMDAFKGNVSAKIAVVLLGGKFLATVFSFGTGGCGGIFAQCLFFGAMLGCCVTGLAGMLGFPLGQEDRLLLMIIGMSSCLGAVVRAPCTSILIVFEMTRQFSLVPMLFVGGILSQALARRIEPRSFYDQVLVNEGHQITTIKPPRDFREWQNYPVSAIASFTPLILRSLDASVLAEALANSPYGRFIYQGESGPPGIVVRAEAERAVKMKMKVEAYPVPVCLRTEAVREAQQKLVESIHGIAVVVEESGKVVGVVTLHDLLRAQQNFSERGD